MSKRTIKFSITIGEWDYKILKIWASIHGKPAAQYAAQIIAARVESSFRLIEKLPEQSLSQKTTKFSVTIGEWDYRHLKAWAAAHSKPLAQCAAQILSARVEENFKLVEEMLSEEARYQGKSPDELEAEILKLPEETDGV